MPEVVVEIGRKTPGSLKTSLSGTSVSARTKEASRSIEDTLAGVFQHGLYCGREDGTTYEANQ